MSGRHRYVLDYRLPASSLAAQAPAIAWDAVGDSWTVGIEDATVELVAPFALTDPVCQVGGTGSTDRCDIDQPEPGHLHVHVTGLDKDRPHKAMYWRSGAYKMIRVGDWKLQVLPKPNKVWLFDLANDPTEKVNLAQSNPAKVAELMAELKRIDGQMVKPAWPSLLQGPIPIDHPLGVPDKPGDEYIYWDN